MKTIILGIVISAASLFSIAPSGPKSSSPVEIFPSAEAATCKARITHCILDSECCSGVCKHFLGPSGQCL